MKKLLPATAAIAALIVTGCTIPTSPPPTSAPAPSTPSAAGTPSPSVGAPSVGSADAVVAATALVRAGAVMAKPVASAPITGGDPQLVGGTLYVYSVRSTESSTRLEWVITYPTAKDVPARTVLDRGSQLLPYLVAGEKEYRISQYIGWLPWLPISSVEYELTPDPRPRFAMYAPLPNEISEIEVRSSLISEPLKIKVDRGPETPPAGSGTVPILGRTLVPSTEEDLKTSLIVAIHGLRRIPSGTVLYFSAAFPEGATETPFESWTPNNRLLQANAIGVYFEQKFGLIDRTEMKGYTPIGGPLFQTCETNHFSRRTSPVARVCWALFPAVDPATTQVDVLVGGTQLVQSVPITDGLMAPASPLSSSGNTVTDLGAGWPAIPEESLAYLTADRAARSTTPLRDVVKDGAVTQSGQQLDLDTKVLFDYNKATLTTAGQAAITKAAEKLKSFNKPGQLTITGHTDSDGDTTANLDLSTRRAQAVADALKPQLGTGYTYAITGKGETEPIASNDTDTGKALNRRVTILPPK